MFKKLSLITLSFFAFNVSSANLEPLNSDILKDESPVKSISNNEGASLKNVNLYYLIPSDDLENHCENMEHNINAADLAVTSCLLTTTKIKAIELINLKNKNNTFLAMPIREINNMCFYEYGVFRSLNHYEESTNPEQISKEKANFITNCVNRFKELDLKNLSN